MGFAPLGHAIGTLTIWHGSILIVIWSVLVANYPQAPPIVGQVLSEKYRFAQVWISAPVFGCT